MNEGHLKNTEYQHLQKLNMENESGKIVSTTKTPELVIPSPLPTTPENVAGAGIKVRVNNFNESENESLHIVNHPITQASTFRTIDTISERDEQVFKFILF